MSNARVKRKVQAICRRREMPYTPIQHWDIGGASLLDQIGLHLFENFWARLMPYRKHKKRWQDIQ